MVPHSPQPIRSRKGENMKNRTRSEPFLNLVLGNGKALRKCSGAECRAFGGFFGKVAERVGDRNVVGHKLTERQVMELAAQYYRESA